MFSSHNRIQLYKSINKKITEKICKYLELRNKHLHNLWIRKEVTREIIKNTELNENKNTAYQNLWDSMKASA